VFAWGGNFGLVGVDLHYRPGLFWMNLFCAEDLVLKNSYLHDLGLVI
jgi:hypothetical protein